MSFCTPRQNLPNSETAKVFLKKNIFTSKTWSSFIYLLYFVIIFSSNVHANKNELRIGLFYEPKNLNPHDESSLQTNEIIYGNIYEGLVKFNASNEIIPWLAERWEFTNSNHTITFYLKKNVLFHNGDKLTSSSVIFSLGNLEKIFGRNYLRRFGEIRFHQVDEHTLIIETEKPSTNFLEYLAKDRAMIMHPYSNLKNAKFPIGTGPYKFISWKKGDNIQLKKFGSYYSEKGHIETVEFVFINLKELNLQIVDNKIDALPFIPLFEGMNGKSIQNRYNIVSTYLGKKIVLEFNLADKKLKNNRLRRAISFGIDTESINQTIFSGYANTIKSLYPEGHKFHFQSKIYNIYRPILTRSILNSLGFTDEKQLSLNLVVSSSYYARKIALLIKEHLAKVNVDLKIIYLTHKEWGEKVIQNNDYQMSLRLDENEFDPNNFIQTKKSQKGYTSLIFNNIVKLLNNEEDGGTKKILHEQAQKKFILDSALIYLIEIPKISLWHSDLEGYSTTSRLGVNLIKNMKFKNDLLKP
mgnify:CR=1 FL=1